MAVTALPDLNVLPADALRALILAQHEQLLSREREIEHLKLLLVKLHRMQFGRKSEKIERQIEQLELRLEELESNRSEEEATPGANFSSLCDSGDREANTPRSAGASAAGDPPARAEGNGMPAMPGRVAWSALDQPSAGMRSKNPAVFAQDDIKLLPNLTINLGLRCEIHGGFSEQNNKAGSFDPTLINPITGTLGSMWFAGQHGRTKAFATVYDNVLPRIGFAYQPTNDWSVRGGVGEYALLWSMDVNGSPIGFGSASTGSISANPGQPPVVQLSSSGQNLPYIIGPNTNPGAYNGQGNGSLPYMPFHTPVSKIWQWSLGVERRLPWEMAGEAIYVGSHGSNLLFQADINQVPANRLGGGQAARPYPQYLGIGPSVPGALTGLYNNISNYNALQLVLRKQLGFGLLANINFTWSKMMDDQDTSGWGGHSGNAYYQDAFNPSANYAPSNFNTPKMFKGYFVYALPAGHGHQTFNHGIEAALLGGWQVSSMFIVQSGTPYTVTMASATNSGALGGFWFPNRVGNPNVRKQSINEWFNQLAYATPATNTFGTNGRNTLNGPDLTDIDLSVGKTFNIPGWEAAQFTLRMDVTNFVNHPSFAAPNAQLSTAALASGVPDPSVGQITQTSNKPRTVQINGRFFF